MSDNPNSRTKLVPATCYYRNASSTYVKRTNRHFHVAVPSSRLLDTQGVSSACCAAAYANPLFHKHIRHGAHINGINSGFNGHTLRTEIT
jgi:hypothetical protein